MVTAMIVGITLTLTILAFVKNAALLHMMCIMAWLLTGYTLFNNTFPSGNAYLPTATMLTAFAMVIIHIVVLITRYLGKRVEPPTYEEEKMQARDRIFKVAHKREDIWRD